ncbi:MAG: CvpA family protein [Oscillospiraceae bacterium]|jgi:hypothetical protein|nr:CvpA family protein [Oscillospiraceae bacterium]
MAEPIQVDFSDKGDGRGRRKEPEKKKAAVFPPERAGLRIALSLVGMVLTALIGWYVMLPPLNFRAQELYYYIALVIGSFIVLIFLLSNAGARPEYVPWVRKVIRVPLGLLLAVALFFGAMWAFSSPLFHARRYSELMPVNQEADFAKDINEPNFSEIPKLDKDSAKVVAGRTLGDLSDLKSQFIISESNTQINYQQKPVRVVALSYADIVRWFTNTGKGLPGYVVVDMANEQSKFVRVEDRIRYTDAEHFQKLLKRHLRFRYPTRMFDIPTFEIDDNGRPFWIAPVLQKTIGLLGGADVAGIVMVDAVNGECKEYSIKQVREDKSMQWIDRVYSAELLTAQYNYYGKYNSGFWNSLLGKKNVSMVTAGYNYLAQNDDVYLYTGVTSADDNTSIYGFIMVNQRTKEANYYKVPGAIEAAAQEAAQGLVSAYRWMATFPLLINVSGEPTYFLSLKDDSGVVQGYAMVNVRQSNKTKVWGKTLAECSSLYLTALDEEGVLTQKPAAPDKTEEPEPGETDADGLRSVTGTIAAIRSAVVNGNTTYYIRLEGGQFYYSITAAQAAAAVLLDTGDVVTITFDPAPDGAAIAKARSVVAE